MTIEKRRGGVVVELGPVGGVGRTEEEAVEAAIRRRTMFEALFTARAPEVRR